MRFHRPGDLSVGVVLDLLGKASLRLVWSLSDFCSCVKFAWTTAICLQTTKNSQR